MRKIISILCILLLIICNIASFSSCSQPVSNAIDSSQPSESPESSTTDDITTGEDQSTTETYSIYPGCDDPIVLEYFDITLSHKPDMEDVFRLIGDVGLRKDQYFSEEVPITKIIEYLGKPHAFGPFSGRGSFVWYSKEGLYLCITYFVSEQAPSDVDPTQWDIETGVAHRLLICNQENSPQPIPSYLFPFRGESYETDDVTTEYKETEAETQPSPYDYLFDYPQANKPTNADAVSITPKMTYAELVDRLGKPHGTYRKKPFYTRIWYTQEGGYLQVEFESLKNTNPEITSPTIEDVVEYCVVKEVTFLEQLDETTEETTEPIPEPETIPVSEW